MIFVNHNRFNLENFNHNWFNRDMFNRDWFCRGLFIHDRFNRGKLNQDMLNCDIFNFYPRCKHNDKMSFSLALAKETIITGKLCFAIRNLL